MNGNCSRLYHYIYHEAHICVQQQITSLTNCQMEISQVSGARSLANGLRFVVHVDDLDLAILNDDIDRPLALLLPEVDACKARARINKLGKQLASLVRLKVARCVQAYKR